MPSLALVQTAFLLQLVLAGLMLIAFGIRYRQMQISRRVARHRARGLAASATSAAIPQNRVQQWAAWLCQDIPIEHRHAVSSSLKRFGISVEQSDTVFGWMRLISAPIFMGLFFGMMIFSLKGQAPLLIMFGFAFVLGCLASFLGARRFAQNLSAQQHEAVTRTMPYALELILIFLDAGLSLTLAFERVADALEERQPSLHDELRFTLADLRVLGSQDLAFKNMAERINTPNMHSIVNILRQSIQYGSPISEAMKNAIMLMRRTEIVLMEEQANKLPSKITLMTLLFIFPPFVVILAGPAMIGLTSAMTKF